MNLRNLVPLLASLLLVPLPAAADSDAGSAGSGPVSAAPPCDPAPTLHGTTLVVSVGVPSPPTQRFEFHGPENAVHVSRLAGEVEASLWFLGDGCQPICLPSLVAAPNMGWTCPRLGHATVYLVVTGNAAYTVEPLN